MAQAARVLRSGGKFALSLWEGAQSRHMSVFKDAVAKTGAPAPPLPPGLPVDWFTDEERLGALLTNAGFVSPAFATISDVYRTESARTLWEEMTNGSVRTAALVTHQSPAVQEQLRTALEQLVEQYRDAVGLAIPMVAKAAYATKA